MVFTVLQGGLHPTGSNTCLISVARAALCTAGSIGLPFVPYASAPATPDSARPAHVHPSTSQSPRSASPRRGRLCERGRYCSPAATAMGRYCRVNRRRHHNTSHSREPADWTGRTELAGRCHRPRLLEPGHIDPRVEPHAVTSRAGQFGRRSPSALVCAPGCSPLPTLATSLSRSLSRMSGTMRLSALPPAIPVLAGHRTGRDARTNTVVFRLRAPFSLLFDYLCPTRSSGIRSTARYGAVRRTNRQRALRGDLE